MHRSIVRAPLHTSHRLALAALIAVAGCAPVRHGPPEPGQAPVAVPALPPGARYEPVLGESPARIANLRAAPPPEQPEISQGGNPAGDERLLTARGYVRIGSGWFREAPADPHEWTARQGGRIGADKALLYRLEGAPGSDVLRVDFYVRYRLPFGATFRSLTKAEQAEAGSAGIEIGEVVGGTPASEANLRRGDFVIAFDGKPVADRAAFEQLLRAHLGQRVTLTVRRDGVKIERLVRLGVMVRGGSDNK
jgi:hypothetical protein